MACSNCNCNSCTKSAICGCPIILSSLCVRYEGEKRLDNISVNIGDRIQDVLVKLDNQIGTLLANQGNIAQLPFFDGRLLYTSTGGETTIPLTDTVNTSANFFLIRNGQFEVDGVGNEYTVDNVNSQIVLTDPLEAGDIIQFYYYIL